MTNSMIKVTPDERKLIETEMFQVDLKENSFKINLILVPCREGKNLRIVVAQAEIRGQMYETPPVVVNLKKDRGWQENFVRYAARALGEMAGIFVPTAAAHA